MQCKNQWYLKHWDTHTPPTMTYLQWQTIRTQAIKSLVLKSVRQWPAEWEVLISDDGKFSSYILQVAWKVFRNNILIMICFCAEWSTDNILDNPFHVHWTPMSSSLLIHSIFLHYISVKRKTVPVRCHIYGIGYSHSHFFSEDHHHYTKAGSTPSILYRA